MAYMNQEKKAKIAAALKKVVPVDWKYSLRVHHHSSIIMTIRSAPIDLMARLYPDFIGDNIDVNHYWAHDRLAECPEKQIILQIIECLNLDNWDRSDSQTDYFDVGHYVTLQIGSWDKPFAVTEQLKKAA